MCFQFEMGVIALLSQYRDHITHVDGKTDGTVESDTNINCTKFLCKRILNTYVNTFILLVFYIVFVFLYFFSTLIFSTNVSDTISVFDSTVLSDSPTF